MAKQLRTKFELLDLRQTSVLTAQIMRVRIKRESNFSPCSISLNQIMLLMWSVKTTVKDNVPELCLNTAKTVLIAKQILIISKISLL